jgi:hypothetical protein
MKVIIAEAAIAMISGYCFATPPGGTNWLPVFSDEFDGASPDRSKWGPFYTWGGRNEKHTHNYDA